MTADLDLESWLEQTAALRDELMAYTKTALPADMGERHVDLDKALRYRDDAGRLLADAESYLTQETARAMLEVRTVTDGLTADERKIMVKDRVRLIQRLVDGLAVTDQVIKSRVMAVLNANRAHA